MCTVGEQLATEISGIFNADELIVHSSGDRSVTIALASQVSSLHRLFDLGAEYDCSIDYKSTPDGPFIQLFPTRTPKPASKKNPWGFLIVWCIAVLFAIAVHLRIHDEIAAAIGRRS